MAIEDRLAAAPAWLFPLGLLSLALLLRLTTLAVWPFDGLYGQDPYFYDHYARDLWSAIAQGESLPRTPWPVGYPLLVALMLPLTGLAATTGQWTSLVTGAAVAPLVYLLLHDLLLHQRLKREAARWTAFIAGLLTAVSGQLWQSSVVVMSDAPALFWATLSAWALVRYTHNGRPLWLLGAALALAWATITRWEYALLIMPYVGYVWLQCPDRKRLWHLIPAAVVGVIALSPQWLLLAGGTTSLGRPDVASWTLLNALRREFVTGAGFDRYPLPTGLFYARPVISPGYLLPLFTPGLIIGVVLVLWHRWWDMAILLLGWVVVMYVVLAGLPFQNFRYSLVYLPPVMLLTAVGLRQAAAWGSARWRGVAHAMIAVGLLAMTAWGAYRVGGLINMWQADKAVVRWVAGQLPADATLLTHGLTLIARHETPYQVFDLYELTSNELTSLTADDKPDYLLIDGPAVEAEWAGRAPQQNYHRLRDGPGLSRLGQYGRYTLFRVGL